MRALKFDRRAVLSARAAPMDKTVAFGHARRRESGETAMNEKTVSLSSVGDLVRAVGLGSEAALKRLYELESRRLYGVALRIVRRPEIAADAVQDAFIQVWNNAASFSAERGDARAWLSGIVRYRALDAARKIRREVLSDDPALGDRAEEPDIVEEIDRKLTAGALRRCLELLEESQRRCVALAFVEGLSHGEIARRLATPLGTVKSWVRRGLLSLRSCLQT
jgi:RNA polymerase sigma-70 factor (ECF subfamily)